jgi:hypothetical protein
VRFSETIKHSGPELLVSRKHDAWLAENDHPVYSERALLFAMHQLKARDRVRKGTVSASSLGECERYQQFVYLGMPKLPPDQKNAMKMQNGSFMHLRWQMAGLTAGWMMQAELPIGTNPYHLSGSMDGVLWDDSVLELKSINVNGFSRITTFGPMHEHLFQMATYMLVTQRERGVFIYECKDNQEYKEIVVGPEDVPLKQAAEQAEVVWTNIKNEEFAEPLNDCLDRKGWRYASCPFRDRCLGIHRWEEVAS